jgi:hypothetical protein
MSASATGSPSTVWPSMGKSSFRLGQLAFGIAFLTIAAVWVVDRTITHIQLGWISLVAFVAIGLAGLVGAAAGLVGRAT